MLDKIKSFFNNNTREALWTFFGLLCLLLFFQISAVANEQKETAIVTNEQTSSLEIHYGNGDVYTVDVKYVAISGGIENKAILNNGYTYQLDMYDYYYDEETNVYTIYLWRDEPYELEKELFTKIS